MSKEDGELFRQVYEIIKNAPEKLLFKEVAKVNEELKDESLSLKEIIYLVNDVNNFVRWIGGNDMEYIKTHIYQIVDTSSGRCIMTTSEWKQYRKKHSPRKYRRRGDSF